MEQDPLQLLVSQATHAVELAVLALACGVLGGRVAARAMRAANLHWSWAALALGPFLLVRPALAPFTFAVLVATITAARRGSRFQRADLRAGGELAELARGRLSPAGVGRSLARAAALRIAAGAGWGQDAGAGWRRGGGAGGSGGGGEALSERLLLGREESGAPVRVRLGPRVPAAHTLVLGATGSGKTVTQALIVAAAVRRGMPAVVVDPKGDGALREALLAAAEQGGRRFLEWTPQGPHVYNPYARGSETEIADRVLAGESFTEPYYQRLAQRYLCHAVRALRAGGGVPSLREIAALLDPERLELHARGLPGAVTEPLLAYLGTLTPRQRADLAGVRDRIAILMESDVGPWLDQAAASPRFELLGALRGGAVVYFALQADSRPLLSQMLGAAVVGDLQGTISTLQSDPLPVLVAIDEFSALAAVQVAALFARARSAGVSLLLATQELADLRVPGHERLLDQVLGNLSLLIVHRQALPASAELLARIGGSQEVWRVAQHARGRYTRTRAAELCVRPERLARLRPGRAAVFEAHERRGARITHIRAGAPTSR